MKKSVWLSILIIIIIIVMVILLFLFILRDSKVSKESNKTYFIDPYLVKVSFDNAESFVIDKEISFLEDCHNKLQEKENNPNVNYSEKYCINGGLEYLPSKEGIEKFKLLSQVSKLKICHTGFRISNPNYSNSRCGLSNYIAYNCEKKWEFYYESDIAIGFHDPGVYSSFKSYSIYECGTNYFLIEYESLVAFGRDTNLYIIDPNENIKNSLFSGEHCYTSNCFSELARKTNSTDLCNRCVTLDLKDECYIRASSSSNDPSICEKIISINDKSRCYKEYATRNGEPEICAFVVYESDKSRCYSDNAKDIETCQEKVNGSIRNHLEMCYENVAYARASLEICDKYLNSSPSCYFRVAILTKKFAEAISICENIEGSFARDSCYEDVAKFQLNTEPCNKIAQESRVDYCIQSVYLKAKNIDLCKEMNSENLIVECYSYFSEYNDDINICGNLGSTNLIEECKDNYLSSKLMDSWDIRICYEMNNAERKNKCINSYRTDSLIPLD